MGLGFIDSRRNLDNIGGSIYLATMKYFLSTSQLLAQESFLRYIGQLYEAFIDMEDNARIDAVNAGETFQVNLKRWERLAETKEPRRFFAGGSGFFLLYVSEEIEAMIYTDLRKAKVSLPTKEKDQENNLRSILQEAVSIKEGFASKAYLKPLAKYIVPVIESILAEYPNLSLESTPSVGGQVMDMEPMQWNSNLNILTTIFYDLTKKQLKNKRMALDATPEQIKAFLSMWFVDKDGKKLSEATLDTYFQEDKPQKRATKRKHPIDSYLEEE